MAKQTEMEKPIKHTYTLAHFINMEILQTETSSHKLQRIQVECSRWHTCIHHTVARIVACKPLKYALRRR